MDNQAYVSIRTGLQLQVDDTATSQPVAVSLKGGAQLEIGGNNGLQAGQDTSITINQGGILAGHGSISLDGTAGAGVIHDNYAIIAKGGTLTVSANIDGTGGLQINANATAALLGSFKNWVLFNGGYATTLRLDLPNPTGAQPDFGGLAVGDTIEMPRSKLPAMISHTAMLLGQLQVTFRDGTTWTYNLSGASTTQVFTVRSLEILDDNKTDGSTVGGYGLTVQQANPKITLNVNPTAFNTGNAFEDSLIWGYGKWVPGSTITYAFATDSTKDTLIAAHGPIGSLDRSTAIMGWTASWKATMQSALQAYSAVCNIHFVQVSDPTLADVVEWALPVLVDPLEGPAAGKSDIPAQVPGGQLWQLFDGDAWTTDPNQLNFGGYGWFAMIHEWGHLLGLAHPHDGGGEPDWTVFPDISQDQAVYTVLSYNQGWNNAALPAPTNDYGTQGGLGAFDVAALQSLYGANSATWAGDTTYLLPAANQIGTGWKSIWDQNGFNTISAAGSTAGVHIDLRPAPLTGPNAGGYQSYTLGVQGGFTIANGSAVN